MTCEKEDYGASVFLLDSFFREEYIIINTFLNTLRLKNELRKGEK